MKKKDGYLSSGIEIADGVGFKVIFILPAQNGCDDDDNECYHSDGGQYCSNYPKVIRRVLDHSWKMKNTFSPSSLRYMTPSPIQTVNDNIKSIDRFIRSITQPTFPARSIHHTYAKWQCIQLDSDIQCAWFSYCRQQSIRECSMLSLSYSWPSPSHPLSPASPFLLSSTAA